MQAGTINSLSLIYDVVLKVHMLGFLQHLQQNPGQKFRAKSKGKGGPLGHVGGMEVGGQMKRA